MRIYQTQNYDKFTFKKGNRNIDKGNLRKISESIKYKYLVTIIVVNEKMEIIDGQHRFLVIQELKLPMYYIIKKEYNIEDIHLLNSCQKRWTNKDYLESYISLGYKEYIKLKEFMKKNDISITIALVLAKKDMRHLGPNGQGIYYSGTGFREYRNGELKINDNQYKEMKEIVNALKDIKKYYEGVKRRSFINAYMKAINTKGYKHETFMKKLAYQSTKLVHCTKTIDYIQVIENIYNFNRKGGEYIKIENRRAK